MIPAPKGLALGATADGEYRLLYAGPDFPSALAALEIHEPEIHVIFIFRNGVLVSTKETPTARVIRDAHLADCQAKAEEAVAKAKADAEAKAEAEAKAIAKAQRTAAATIAKDTREREVARAKRDAELLKAAAQRAAKLATATEKESKTKPEPETVNA